MYRVGFPGWKLAARFGRPLVFNIEVLKDEEAGVFVATSPDLRGLVAEAATLEELFHEVRLGADALITEQVHGRAKSEARLAWSGEFCPA
ncbi:DUF1902 domain-containing protein [Xenophilus sp. Marseille-Q4582]|uniref:DUF1902 domain-containing protein n=1 Tax=Xenophilus sp. Marseille-Q4582 TaxID=2866600 RepID=UPI001CE4A784|nr:DUF1902 domain-containing protein [Xenophilus sp. Marseille-Q4582]